MKFRSKLLFWSPVLLSAAVQLLAAAMDFALWESTLLEQLAVSLAASLFVVPVLILRGIVGWLASRFFLNDTEGRWVILGNSIAALALCYGILIALMGDAALLGAMLLWDSDFPWGIVSMLCMAILPLVFSGVYEYQLCRDALPGVEGEDIVKYIITADCLTAEAVILLVLLALFWLRISG